MTEITDSCDGLQILHNTQQDSYLRGEIRVEDTGAVLVPSIGYLEETVSEPCPGVAIPVFPSQDFPWEEYHVALSLEATLLRLFYWNNTWRIATHKKLDAFRSRWGASLSFGHIFVRCLEARKTTWDEFVSFLDTSRVYFIFIMNNVENRIVYNPLLVRNPLVYFGHFDAEKHWHTQVPDPEPGTGVFDPVSPEKKGLDSLARLQGVVIDPKTWKRQFDELTDPARNQGFYLIPKSNHRDTHWKIYLPRYYRGLMVRGNQPNPIVRFLEIEDDGERMELYNMYPELQAQFNFHQYHLLRTLHTLYGYYTERFVHRKFVVVPRADYRVICTFHNRDPLQIQPFSAFLKFYYQMTSHEHYLFMTKILERYL